MRRLFEANNLEDHVDGMIAKVIKPKPTNQDKAANNTYKEQKSANATACLAITLNLKETPQQVVIDYITAKSIWDILYI